MHGIPSCWKTECLVNLLRRDERRLTAAERFAPVWHVTHLHKAGMFGKFAKDIIPSARWPRSLRCATQRGCTVSRKA